MFAELPQGQEKSEKKRQKKMGAFEKKSGKDRKLSKIKSEICLFKFIIIFIFKWLQMVKINKKSFEFRLKMQVVLKNL